MVFEWCEWAHPSDELDDSAIQGHREMYQSNAPPSPCQESAKDHERNKGDMDEDEPVGEKSVQHQGVTGPPRGPPLGRRV